jgi:hypothetical protein
VLKPTAVRGGEVFTCKVQLTDPSPIGGMDIDMSQSQNACLLPTVVHFNVGEEVKVFSVLTRRTSRNTTVVITASHGQTQRSATLTIKR